jgi:hypothetical protein
MIQCHEETIRTLFEAFVKLLQTEKSSSTEVLLIGLKSSQIMSASYIVSKFSYILRFGLNYSKLSGPKTQTIEERRSFTADVRLKGLKSLKILEC